LAILSLKNTDRVGKMLRKYILSKLCGQGFYSPDENVILSISYDPKTCGIPKENCCGDCIGCYNNPLTHLLCDYSSEGPFVITRRDTIKTLLDVIELLASANSSSLDDSDEY